jgi:hypothetical protein
MRHCAFRIFTRNCLKLSACFGVSEGMQQGYTPLQLTLDFGGTRSWKGHLSQLIMCTGRIGVVVIGTDWAGKQYYAADQCGQG